MALTITVLYFIFSKLDSVHKIPTNLKLLFKKLTSHACRLVMNLNFALIDEFEPGELSSELTYWVSSIL